MNEAFEKVASSLKIAQGTQPMTIYRGMAMQGGVLEMNGSHSFTITPGIGGTFFAYAAANNNSQVKVEATCAGQSVLSDSNEFGGMFTVEDGKRYTISAVNKGGKAYVGILYAIVGTSGSPLTPEQLMTTVNRASETEEGMKPKGYYEPVGTTLQGAYITPAGTHKEIIQNGSKYSKWALAAVCAGNAGLLTMTFKDASNAVMSQDKNDNDVALAVFETAIPTGKAHITTSAATFAAVLMLHKR